MNDDGLKLLPPIYLIGMKLECWRCGKRMPVVTLMAEVDQGVEKDLSYLGEDEGPSICVLSQISNLPNELIAYLLHRVPTFQLRYSKTIQGKYYANTCPHCGTLFGDFFLHTEPGDPFFPTTEEEASALYLTEVPIDQPIHVQAGLTTGTADLILEHAKRIK